MTDTGCTCTCRCDPQTVADILGEPEGLSLDSLDAFTDERGRRYVALTIGGPYHESADLVAERIRLLRLLLTSLYRAGGYAAAAGAFAEHLRSLGEKSGRSRLGRAANTNREMTP